MSDVAKLVSEGALALRRGVSTVRIVELKEFVKRLLEVKKAGLDPALLGAPEFDDSARVAIQGSIASVRDMSGNVGINWSFVSIGGDYSKKEAQTATLNLEMAFRSSGAPNIEQLQKLEEDNLNKLLTLLESFGA